VSVITEALICLAAEVVIGTFIIGGVVVSFGGGGGSGRGLYMYNNV